MAALQYVIYDIIPVLTDFQLLLQCPGMLKVSGRTVAFCEP